MAEEVLSDTLDGNIPLQEVLTWISNETCGPFLEEKLGCSRGDFVLCLLNFVRCSSKRAWESTSFQSPLKSIAKSSKLKPSNNTTVYAPRSGEKRARRVELFPKAESQPSQKLADQENKEHAIIHDACVSLAPSPGPHFPISSKQGAGESYAKGISKEEGLTAIADHPVTSSPCSSAKVLVSFPQLTPINKRGNYFKSNERSPCSTQSSDHQLKTPTRNNGICLGDFLVKGSKSQNSKKKTSESALGNLSPTHSNNPPDNGNYQSSKKKHRRRINPTKVSLENTTSSEQTSFTKPHSFGLASQSIPDLSPFQAPVSVEPLEASQSFSEERNLLKQERLKLLSQGENNMTPVATMTSSKPVGHRTTVTADPDKVTHRDQLLKIGDLYCCVIDNNLAPNLMSELYFIISLLVIRFDSNSPETVPLCVQEVEENNSTKDIKCTDISMNPLKDVLLLEEERQKGQYFSSVHNCVFFATHVLLKELFVLSNLDRPTLKLLLDCDRVALFAPALKEGLLSAYFYSISKTKVSEGALSKKVASGNVSFQSDTDNSSNFPSAQCFSNFRKQRDGFYELLRIWEANHLKQDWCFATSLGSRVRSLVYLCSDPVNLMHFARLFRLQLVSTVNGVSNPSDENADDLQFLEGLKGIDPDKLNRLRGRLVSSYKVVGPRPAPSFHGHQEFYKDFIIYSSHSSFMHHLQDSLISHLLELDGTSFLASDTEDSDLIVDANTRQSYLSCVITMRLLAKFLGLIVFLPYSRPDTNLPLNILEAEVAVRAKVTPPLNILKCLVNANKMHRLIVTVPWTVKFLGMMDSVSCTLPVYRTVFQFLLHIYLALHQENCSSILGKKLSLPSQTALLLRLTLGWLFEAPFLQDNFFYPSCFRNDESLLLMALDVGDTSGTDTSIAALDSSDLSVSFKTFPPVDALNLVDCEVLYALCPFLSELKSLLASNSSECAPGSSVRHITPVSAGSSTLLSQSSGKQLELKLEDSFFHGLPASVHRTVEFVVERVTSSCVKHICNVWLPGLKQKGLKNLQEKIKSLQDDIDLENDNSSIMQSKLKTEISIIVDSVSQELKARCRSGVGYFCLTKCRGALMSLLPEESLSLPVCEMCVNIASRMTEERVVTWMLTHATLSLYSKDLQFEAEKYIKNRDRVETVVIAKTSHIAPGASASWEHDDAAPSPVFVLQTLKLMVCDILNGKNVSRETVTDILDKMEQCVTKRQDVVPAAERILALLSVDLVVSLVCHNPCLVDSSFLLRLINLWKLDALRPVEDGLARLVCPRNMLLLAQSNHPARLVWEKLAEVVASVLKANLVTADLVENECLAIMQQEWPQNILRCFAMCMNEVVRQYQKQKDVDYKFVLLLEWLAETTAQIDCM